MTPIFKINCDESPKEVIAADFKLQLPIRGGWGYSQEDACIIDKYDPLVDPSCPFNGVKVEYGFIEKRIYEEMIIFRPDGEKFSGIEWNLLKQSTLHAEERTFDKLIFEITAFSDNDWAELKADFEKANGNGHFDFDADAHEKKRQDKILRFTSEFWFDITTFYGQGLIINDKSTEKEVLLQPESFQFER